MRRIYWKAILSIGVIIVIVLLLWKWIGSEHKEKGGKENISVHASKTTSIVQLSPLSLKQSNIKVAKLKVVTKPEQYEAYGKIVLPQTLVDAHNRFTSAKAQSQKMDAQLAASSKEYERLKNLYQHHDVSVKNLQMMEATFLSDEASASAAKNAFQAEIDSLRLQWGKQIADWIMNSSQNYFDLIQLHHYLLQLTLAQGIAPVALPQKALVQMHDHGVLEAQFISQAPTTDVQIQGLSFYFLLENKNSLLPGMNIAAYLSMRQQVQGAMIPRSAVVWWQGSPWVYVEIAPQTYQRKKIDTHTPTKNGFLVPHFNVKHSIVIQGAQTLLSQEILGSNNAAPEED